MSNLDDIDTYKSRGRDGKAQMLLLAHRMTRAHIVFIRTVREDYEPKLFRVPMRAPADPLATCPCCGETVGTNVEKLHGEGGVGLHAADEGTTAQTPRATRDARPVDELYREYVEDLQNMGLVDGDLNVVPDDARPPEASRALLRARPEVQDVFLRLSATPGRGLFAAIRGNHEQHLVRRELQHELALKLIWLTNYFCCASVDDLREIPLGPTAGDAGIFMKAEWIVLDLVGTPRKALPGILSTSGKRAVLLDPLTCDLLKRDDEHDLLEDVEIKLPANLFSKAPPGIRDGDDVRIPGLRLKRFDRDRMHLCCWINAVKELYGVKDRMIKAPGVSSGNVAHAAKFPATFLHTDFASPSSPCSLSNPMYALILWNRAGADWAAVFALAGAEHRR